MAWNRFCIGGHIVGHLCKQHQSIELSGQASLIAIDHPPPTHTHTLSSGGTGTLRPLLRELTRGLDEIFKKEKTQTSLVDAGETVPETSVTCQRGAQTAV